MVYTSNYKNVNLEDLEAFTLSISGDKGKSEDPPYTGKCDTRFAPKKDFWKVWKANIGKVDEKENNKFYIREFYDKVLSGLDVDTEYRNLDEKVLLCYEGPMAFCHRQVVAAWFELLLGVKVPEIVQVGYDIKEVPTDREWIKDYLEEYMKEKIDTKGFNSLHAFHVYEKAQKLETNASNNNDIELALDLRTYAYEEENRYLENKKGRSKRVDN